MDNLFLIENKTIGFKIDRQNFKKKNGSLYFKRKIIKTHIVS